MNIDNSEESTKSSANHRNSKKICIVQNIWLHVFLFENLSQGNFLIPKLFIQLF